MGGAQVLDRRKAGQDAAPQRTRRSPKLGHTVGGDRFGGAPGAVQAALASPGKPLDAATRGAMESRLGHDFGQVQVHSDATAAASARAVGALAYTYGDHVVFGQGRYAPGTGAGDHVLQHELSHVAEQGGGEPVVQRMVPCPPAWPGRVPSGWKPYYGNSGVFHCGFRGMLEDRRPTPGDPQNECFYDHSDALVDESHPFAGCRGTPNSFDSATQTWDHFANDPGGVVQAGAPAFITSRVHDVHQALEVALAVPRAMVSALGQAVALGLYKAKAMVNPANWSFQGLPARSVGHLNVMGALLSSVSMAGTLDRWLANITKRLGDYAIGGLLDDIAADVTQALRARNPTAPAVAAADLRQHSLLELADWLRSQGLLAYVRPPDDIAWEELAASQQAQPAAPTAP